MGHKKASEWFGATSKGEICTELLNTRRSVVALCHNISPNKTYFNRKLKERQFGKQNEISNGVTIVQYSTPRVDFVALLFSVFITLII
jgi:hypothetical protein